MVSEKVILPKLKTPQCCPFVSKVAGKRPRMCFTVSFANFFKVAFLEHLRRTACVSCVYYKAICSLKLVDGHLNLSNANPRCKSSRPQMFFKKDVLKNLQISQENKCVGVFFLIKLQTFRSTTLLKRDSNRGVFL